MEERPFDTRFPSSEELLEFLREHADDIENVTIPVQSAVLFTSPSGPPVGRKGVGAVIKVCSGRSLVIGREDAAMLINDGVLQRMRIQCVLDPLDGSSNPT